jgi:hypothetical protein
MNAKPGLMATYFYDINWLADRLQQRPNYPKGRSPQELRALVLSSKEVQAAIAAEGAHGLPAPLRPFFAYTRACTVAKTKKDTSAVEQRARAIVDKMAGNTK